MNKVSFHDQKTLSSKISAEVIIIKQNDTTAIISK